MIPKQNAHLHTASNTHAGMTGKNNEDRFAILNFALSETDATPSVFALVADGVGGKLGGEIAATMAVEIIGRVVTASDASNPVATLMQALYDANTAILEKSRDEDEIAGMATTATCAWVIGSRLYAANVGNSRLYLLRENVFRQISIDHSWVQEAIEHGIITPDQAHKHPNSHVITRHLGAEKMTPDMRLRLSADETNEACEGNQGTALQPGDILFLCSDGLSDVVENVDIHAALQNRPMQDALEHLTALANEHGGPDNITTVALHVPAQPAETAKPAELNEPTEPTRKRRHPLARLGIYLLSAVILTVLIVAGRLALLNWAR